MIARIALAAVVVAVVLIARSAGDPYRVIVALPTAAGLREGADVKVGGAIVGKVSSLRLGRDDSVTARLELRDGAQVGPEARVAVRATNLLGDKFLALEPGKVTRAAHAIPAERVSLPVELDQVLDVLDPRTRVRLAVLLDQAGRAVAGREADVGETVAVFGPGLDRVRRLVGDIHADNAALRRTLTTADGWAGRFAAEREALGDVVDTASGTMATVATERDQLRATLARAPGTLRAARGLLADLERTTVPLEPAARALSATAPALTDTLAELPAFRRAAAPALRSARTTAPALTTLARRTTPTLRRARPALRSVRGFAQQLAPFSAGLADSVEGMMSLMHGWSRAVQTRDGAGHVFRGDFIFGPELLRHALDQFGVPNRSRRRPSRRPRPSVPVKAPAPAATAPPALTRKPIVPQVTDEVDQVVGEATKPVQPLLDFLLGP